MVRRVRQRRQHVELKTQDGSSCKVSYMLLQAMPSSCPICALPIPYSSFEPTARPLFQPQRAFFSPSPAPRESLTLVSANQLSFDSPQSHRCYTSCSHFVRRRIISLYEEIHAAGVIHGDVDWKHILGREWLRTPQRNSDEITAVDPGSIRLIDFGRSRTRYAFATTCQNQSRSQCQSQCQPTPAPDPEALGSVGHQYPVSSSTGLRPEASSTHLRPVELVNDAKWTRM